MRFVRVVFFTLFLGGAAVARAQSAHWENGDSALGNVVQLVFQDCEPDGDPQLPPIANATLSFAGRSESVNMVNMSVSRTTTYSYLVQAQHSGPLKIPAFTVNSDKGPIQVAAFNAAAPSISAASVASSKLIPDANTVWAGQIFGLTYRLTAARRNNPQVNPTFDWNPAPLVIEDWSKPEVVNDVVGGEREAEITYHTRGYARAASTVTLKAVNHLLQVQTGSVGFGLFSQARMEPVSVASDQPTIEVRPLPTPPPGFGGAVGQFKLTSKVVPKHAGIGEPVTWTLELTGTGNWPDIAGLPAREVSKDFQVIQPKAKRTPAEGKLFDVTLSEDVVLVPTKAGTYRLDPVKFIYFDPASSSYKDLSTERTTITITPPPTPQFTPPSVASSSGTATEPAKSTPKPNPLTVPLAPGGIPRDPLPGQVDAPLPMSDAALIGWLLIPVAWLLAFWLTLACRRAMRTDPLRAQREAHARLLALLADIRTNPTRERLLEWQHDAAILWRIPHAAPSDAIFSSVGHIGGATPAGSASVHAGSPAQAAEWAQLWREADAALYSANSKLPPDWAARAEATLAAKRIPGFRPARLFLPQNLLPFAATVALLISLAPRSLVGGVTSPSIASLPMATALGEPSPSSDARGSTVTRTPETAYGAGDFAEAEAGWRSRVENRPTDWIARHNLSLALAQQDRFGEAAAEAAAAFVQHPNDPAVHAEFDFATDKAGFAPAPLVGFLREGPLYSLAILASPAVWQRILIVAAFIVALAVGWAIWNAYGRRRRLVFWLAAVTGGISALLTIAAAMGHDAYGETANVRAVVAWQAGTLRSIPTEADTTQKTTALAAGSVAIVDKTFLQWDRLVFANGQTGWVRQEDIIPLWR